MYQDILSSHYCRSRVYERPCKRSQASFNAGLTSLDIKHDSLTVCTGSEDFTAQLVNLQTGRVLGSLAGRPSSKCIISFIIFWESPFLASACSDLSANA